MCSRLPKRHTAQRVEGLAEEVAKANARAIVVVVVVVVVVAGPLLLLLLLWLLLLAVEMGRKRWAAAKAAMAVAGAGRGTLVSGRQLDRAIRIGVPRTAGIKLVSKPRTFGQHWRPGAGSGYKCAIFFYLMLPSGAHFAMHILPRYSPIPNMGYGTELSFIAPIAVMNTGLPLLD